MPHTYINYLISAMTELMLYYIEKSYHLCLRFNNPRATATTRATASTRRRS